MPTVQIQQLTCATPRHQELDYHARKYCRCPNVPALSARVSKLTLHDGNVTAVSKGFSTIIHPSRDFSPPIKIVKGSSLISRSTIPVSSTVSQNSKTTPLEKKIFKNRSSLPSQQCLVLPTRNSSDSASASRITSAISLPNNNRSKTKNTSNDSLITNRLANVFISGRSLSCNHSSLHREDAPKCSTNTNTKYLKYKKFSQFSKVYVKNNINNDDKVKNDQTSISASQRLHPGWRRVPWKPHFGWTASHQELCKLLQKEIKKGSLESIYYRSEEEYSAAGISWRAEHEDSPFLSGPSVSTVAEVLEVIKKITTSRSPWLYSGKASRWNRWVTYELSDYDADDED